MEMSGFLILALIVVLVVSLVLAARQWTVIALSERRLREAGELNRSLVPEPDEERGALGNWLALAGFRAPAADWIFLVLLFALSLLGLSIAWFLVAGGHMARAAAGLDSVAGGIGNIFLPFVLVLPWLVVIFLALLPIMIVNAARRRRVQAVEADLLLFLELMATLTEAGESFDSALNKILKTQREDRPLATELKTLQKDFLAGRSRLIAFRRFARRMDIMSVNIFVSAIVQSEMVGSNIAATLRSQAETIRERRRDNAISWVMSAPTRLLFPLAICFLPALFLFALGPSFHTALQFIEMVTSGVPQR